MVHLVFLFKRARMSVRVNVSMSVLGVGNSGMTHVPIIWTLLALWL